MSEDNGKKCDPLQSAAEALAAKNSLYGHFLRHDDKMQELQRKLLAKSFDVPYDDMRDVTITKNDGSGLLKGIVVGAAMLAGGAGIGGGAIALLSRQLPSPQQQPQVTPAPVESKPIKLKVKWWVENGQLKSRVVEEPEP